jgi:chromosome segregation ATPase
MGQSELDKVKDAANKAINSKVANFRKEYDSKMGQHKRIAQKLERLKDAKRLADREMSELNSFKSKVNREIKKTSTGSFKGTRRQKFEQTSEQIIKAVNSQHDKNQDEIDALNRKISKLEFEESSVGGAMAEISATISGLMAMLK